MERKQQKNRCRKALARVFAGVFCALSWTTTVHAAGAITLGEGDQLAKVLAEQWLLAASKTHDKDPYMYTEINLTTDISVPTTIHIHARSWVVVHLNGHKIIHEAQLEPLEPRALFCVGKEGVLEIEGPGGLDGGWPKGSTDALPTGSGTFGLLTVLQDGAARLKSVELANNAASERQTAIFNAGIAVFLDCRFSSLIVNGNWSGSAITNAGVLYVRPTDDPAGDFVDCGTKQNPPVSSSDFDKAKIRLIPLEEGAKTAAAWDKFITAVEAGNVEPVEGPWENWELEAKKDEYKANEPTGSEDEASNLEVIRQIVNNPEQAAAYNEHLRHILNEMRQERMAYKEKKGTDED
ncbi:MAG: hypothetical protein LBB04_03740 [Oscillospiraceae bacterium]|jgi:hypothetical protein|nr:hypothetical protein [Oscillospiraceae bacterium]